MQAKLITWTDVAGVCAFTDSAFATTAEARFIGAPQMNLGTAVSLL